MQNAKNQLGVLNAPTRKTAGLAVSDIYKAYQPNMPSENEDLRLLAQVLEIYPRKFTLSYLQLIVLGKWTEELLQRCFEGEQPPNFSEAEYWSLQRLLPEAPPPGKSHDFDFVDLFAGIGGMRKGFEQAGGRCVFTSEWNPFALRTYKANYYSDARVHKFNEDIRDVTLSARTDISDEEAHHFINETVPDHDILLAGFPCQPFSVTDVASIDFPGRDAFEWHPQGTLFFDIARIIAAKRPVAFVLENVKNLKSHDRGTTYAVIMAALDELGYWVADADANGDPDPKIIDGAHFVPQHRERIVLVGFRKDLGVHEGFTLKDISKLYPLTKPTLGDILDKEVDPRYTLTPKLWEYLFNYSVKHKQNGNGFGYGLVGPNAVTRTLSARYHKDGSEILVDRGFDPALGLCHEKNMANRPRRLTPRECARLMGFDGPGESNFRIPVSDTQAYKQFGNSVVVPVFAAVARLMKERVMAGKNILASPQHRYEDSFEHTFQTIDQLSAFLGALGAERAVIKQLPKNANDKNQIRLAPDFGVLFDDFDLTLSERGESTSLTKERSAPGTRIPEAVFNDFSWLRNDGALVPAKQIKAIIYTQYPEARLSGLQAVDGTMPVSLSVAYTKRYSDARRVLILARLPLGKCIGIVCVDPAPVFFEGLAGLPGIRGAAACKRLQIDTGNRYRLEQMLAEVLGRPLRGCRLDANGQTLPFSGTQVCGYTLEHALGIIPNSNKDGDLFGIELKTHTQLKVTLFTPEPDGGLYAADFAAFMKTYGYRDADGDYRVTGIHRANELCGKSGLTLRVREQRLGSDGTIQVFPYDPTTPLTPKLDSIDVALIAADGTVAASWSLQRLMNCWGAKHNEVVYVPATKVANPNATECAEGYEHHVTLGQTVIWCRDTTAERLLQAIEDGVIYLDPAPKLHATDASKNKRRAQWRVNDITKAVYALYSVVEMKTIAGGPGFAARKAA